VGVVKRLGLRAGAGGRVI